MFLLEHKLQLHNIKLSPAFDLNLNHNLDLKIVMDHSWLWESINITSKKFLKHDLAQLMILVVTPVPLKY